jgi:molybdopterin-binding protein
MRISARNNLKGKIARIVHGPVGAEVTIHVAPGVEIVSTITDTSARELGLKEGMVVHAIIKASSVMVATD